MLKPCEQIAPGIRRSFIIIRCLSVCKRKTAFVKIEKRATISRAIILIKSFDYYLSKLEISLACISRDANHQGLFGAAYKQEIIEKITNYLPLLLDAIEELGRVNYNEKRL